MSIENRWCCCCCCCCWGWRNSCRRGLVADYWWGPIHLAFNLKWKVKAKMLSVALCTASTSCHHWRIDAFFFSLSLCGQHITHRLSPCRSSPDLYTDPEHACPLQTTETSFFSSKMDIDSKREVFLEWSHCWSPWQHDGERQRCSISIAKGLIRQARRMPSQRQVISFHRRRLFTPWTCLARDGCIFIERFSSTNLRDATESKFTFISDRHQRRTSV